MAVSQLITVPTDYWDVRTFVNDKRNRDGDRKIAHNTFARHFTDHAQGKAKVATIQYHYTPIIKFYAEKPGVVEFRLNGWDTVTTRGRIHPIIQAFWKRNAPSRFYAGLGRRKGVTILTIEALHHTYEWEIDPYSVYRINVARDRFDPKQVVLPLVTTSTQEGWLSVVPTKVIVSGH